MTKFFFIVEIQLLTKLLIVNFQCTNELINDFLVFELHIFKLSFF
jgi:hypothetical protein